VTGSTIRRARWPKERPIRTIIGFLGIALGAKVVHRVRYQRVDHIPTTGPGIIVANHLSTTETLAVARLITGHGRFPHFLATAEAFTWPVAGWVLRAARQIPVFRGSDRARDSLLAAAKELERGHIVCLYPEGHLTTNQDLRPGPGKSGAARLACAHPSVPVIPVGLWGPRHGVKHIWHRHTVRLVVGEPVDLSAWSGADDPDSFRQATEKIMTAITALAEQARGSQFDVEPG